MLSKLYYSWLDVLVPAEESKKTTGINWNPDGRDSRACNGRRIPGEKIHDKTGSWQAVVTGNNCTAA